VTVVDPEIIKRVKAAKARRRSSAEQYRDWSRIAFIVHSFNRAANVEQLASGLRRIPQHELIVCDDGSLDGSRKRWLKHLVHPHDFLILSNDLHEIRILDRAIRFARAAVVCLVQDDDSIPRGTRWLESALERFETHPKLAIIGGFMGFCGFDPDPRKVRCIWAKAPFQFVDHVNIGPYFIHRKHYLELGGWDFSFSRASEPGICFDNELCLRAWVNGYQVGYSFVPFKGPPECYSLDGGTMLFSAKSRRINQLQNGQKIFRKYAEHGSRIARLVEEANRALRRGARSL
jgi:glycosyltransferase involved in cell wall biosynthesis